MIFHGCRMTSSPPGTPSAALSRRWSSVQSPELVINSLDTRTIELLSGCLGSLEVLSGSRGWAHALIKVSMQVWEPRIDSKRGFMQCQRLSRTVPRPVHAISCTSARLSWAPQVFLFITSDACSLVARLKSCPRIGSSLRRAYCSCPTPRRPRRLSHNSVHFAPRKARHRSDSERRRPWSRRRVVRVGTAIGWLLGALRCAELLSCIVGSPAQELSLSKAEQRVHRAAEEIRGAAHGPLNSSLFDLI